MRFPATACAAAALLAGPAAAADGPAQEPLRWLVELKRQATARGTPDETTKTNLKIEYRPDGPVSLLRLELPFPDADTDFEGSPFDPDFGDMKVRVGFRAVEVMGRPVTSFAEMTFPTADPESQGSGKYQIGVGVRATVPLDTGTGGRRDAFAAQVQQVVSFAGDAERKDINQTKIELEARGTWAPGHLAKATLKPFVDWVGDKRTGGVLEVEGGWAASRAWLLSIMGGARLWGAGVPGTYTKRVELKAAYRF